MLSLLVPQTILGIDTIWVLTSIVMVLGVILISVAAKLKNYETVHHLVRDIGIAFFVAGLITVIYEHVVDFRRMSDAISIIVGENVPPPVLNAVTTQVFRREVIRENFELRWTVVEDSSLPDGQAMIKVHISYDLYGLKPHPFEFSVGQELEHYNIPNKDRTLPRFDSVTVGTKTYRGDELQQMVKDGSIALPKVTINPWHEMGSHSPSQGNAGIRFVFERSEIINIPGSYSTVLSQLTKGVRLEVKHPSTMEHKLKEWFDRGGLPMQPAGDNYYELDAIVLPGQSISVQFSRAGSSAINSAPPNSPTKKP